MDINSELIVREKKRENCFRFLSGFFYFPEKSLFVEANLFENLTGYLQTVCIDAVRFAVEMEKNIHNYTDKELQVDYAKLFKGPYELLAPPYGSVYLDEGRRVMGDSTMEVIQVYEQEGLARSNDFKDLPDHVVVEMEFMSFLIYQELEALEKSDVETAQKYMDKQEAFLKIFLRQWIPPFCCKIKEGTENSFYTSLADCLSTFILNPNMVEPINTQ